MLTFKFGKIKYGWMNLDIYFNGVFKTSISCSGVYNPFYETSVLFRHLRARKDYSWIIDQEGRLATISFKNIGSLLKISISNDRDNSCFLFTVSKKKFLDQFKKDLNLFYSSQKKEINDLDYSFYFRPIV